MGIMECSATCPCSQNPRHQGKWAIYGAEDAEDYGVQPTWMAETEGPSASQSSLDSTNLTHWANANDSDDIKYLIGGFIGGVLATAEGAIAGEWAVQRMKKHGKLL